MSNGRRVARPIRQLSLQQPVSRRQQIRRQRSTDDDYDKSLQIYASSIARRKSVTNSTKTSKHVRVAWSQNDSDSGRGLAQVEVIAHRIPNRFKSTTNRFGKSTGMSILYSRQDLAERLRLAWKHREENKANIDIFLVHGMEERCNTELSMSVPPISPSTKEPDYIQDDISCSSDMETFNFEVGEKEKCKIDNKNKKECEKASETAPGMLEKYKNVTSDVKNEAERNEKEKSSQINPGIEKKKKARMKIDCSHPPAMFPSLQLENVNSTKLDNDNFSMAKQKRASFHSGTNRAFLVPTTEKLTKDKITPAKSIENRCASAKTAIKSPIDTVFAKNSSTVNLGKMRRANSAPPPTQNVTARVQVNIVIDASDLTEVTDKSIDCGKMQNRQDTVEKDKGNLTKISRVERSVKSAPLKRKSKGAKRHLFTSLGSSKCKDENNTERRKSCSVDPRTSDVITMVSLISSADSDSDMENSSSEDKLIDELRNKLPTTPIIKTSNNTSLGITRKPIKSVSFQRSSFEIPTRKEKHIVNDIEPCRLNLSINVAQRKANENLAKQDLIVDNTVVTPSTLAAVSTLITQNTQKTISETPLNEREKRCLAVPIGELYDKKWKLLQAKSASSYVTVTERINNSPMEGIKEQNQHFIMSPIDLVTSSSSPINNPVEKVGQFSKETLTVKETLREMSEPYLQTTKEKECWHLYKRMCDKGVCVSFNTVLRGMLTPTEYRMRQKELS